MLAGMAPSRTRAAQPATASAGVGTRPGSTGGQPTPYAREVLDLVDRIPRGKVMTYGDVAEMHGRGSARTVGAVMAHHGREVPWHRVVQASGRPAEPYVQEALSRLVAEGCPVAGERVVLTSTRWDGREAVTCADAVR
jgi:alkylated DNA nucleotide flippase Atl1